MSRRARQRLPAIEAKRAAAWSGPEPEPVETAATRCVAEWQGVNDPPRHPSDAGWKPCRLCEHRVDSAEWFMARAQESKQTLAQLAKVLPGCFEADGSAIVASAHFPRLPKE